MQVLIFGWKTKNSSQMSQLINLSEAEDKVKSGIWMKENLQAHWPFMDMILDLSSQKEQLSAFTIVFYCTSL